MIAKLQAAKIANAAGAHLAILSGKLDHPLRAFDAPGRGTVFVAGGAAKAKKAWLAGRLTAKGRLHVDAGAVRALRDGRSLLAAGVQRVEGRFARGDVVEVWAADAPVARGLSAYSDDEAAKLAGTRNDAQAAILGYAPRSAAIHRDHLVLL